MPKALGFLEAYPQRVVLSVFGLRRTYASHKLLAGFQAILRLAAERYASEASSPQIMRQDAARGTAIDDFYVTALSRILYNQVPFPWQRDRRPRHRLDARGDGGCRAPLA